MFREGPSPGIFCSDFAPSRSSNRGGQQLDVRDLLGRRGQEHVAIPAGSAVPHPWKRSCIATRSSPSGPPMALPQHSGEDRIRVVYARCEREVSVMENLSRRFTLGAPSVFVSTSSAGNSCKATSPAPVLSGNSGPPRATGATRDRRSRRVATSSSTRARPGASGRRGAPALRSHRRCTMSLSTGSPAGS